VIRIADQPEGVNVAIELLGNRLYADRSEKRERPPELVTAGCELLRRLTFSKRDPRQDHELETILSECLGGTQGPALVTDVCAKLKRAIIAYETHTFYHTVLLHGFFKAQPKAGLDGLCAGGQSELQTGMRIIADAARARGNPLDAIADDVLLAWCDEDPALRYPAIAGAVTITQPAPERGAQKWSSIARKLIDRAPDKREVLKHLIRQFWPLGGWVGSFAATLEANAQLLEELRPHPDPDVDTFLVEQHALLVQEVAAKRGEEQTLTRWQDERFE
jgi:hypothetical protein